MLENAVHKKVSTAGHNFLIILGGDYSLLSPPGSATGFMFERILTS